MKKKRLLPILIVCLVLVGGTCLAIFGENSPVRLDKSGGGDGSVETMKLTAEEKEFVQAFSEGEVEPVSAPIKLNVDYNKNAKVGDKFDVIISTDSNPGICAAQFTLAYNKAVLKCNGMELGPVIQKMSVNICNPDAEDGAIAAGASVAPTTEKGTLATITFEVIKEGDFGFRLLETTFTDAYDNELSLLTNLDVGEIKDNTNTDVDNKPADNKQAGDKQVNTKPGEKTDSDKKNNTSGDKSTFKDTQKSWAKKYIDEAAKQGLVNGVGNDKYQPESGMTRAQFVTILYRSEVASINEGEKNYSGKMPFTDTASGKWYSAAVVWAEKNKIVNGIGGGKFDPESGVTREQIATILFRLAGEKQGGEVMYFTVYDKAFKDSGKISSWAKNGVYWAVFNEIWCGKDAVSTQTKLYPRDFADRAQIAVMMVKYGEYKEAA